ncbi:glycerol-3-phosphate 1-O-acyltransferase PlsY [Thiospirillum jenense]|uniref:Glycerol-3-phosphate acyltransferase n=1 Tax=Thiospirillum jenense TaxID=1653858 RepID=A0A839HBS3_9GAMM|nr:glycerol-3-phosphate 1-O-acyltransferase PlsY [Thiospirillum jenense]MBB1126141.1 glycerol-3-phosphate 1-O-acyltransferase PlsY [Thiospirillum jenense]
MIDHALLFGTGLIAAAYLLGSISSAILVCRIMGLPDPRTHGSHNPGATNVLRVGGTIGKVAAAITLLGDSLKGVLPMLIGSYLQVTPQLLAAIGIAAFLGHLYPIFFNFKGGKGVATALGVQLGLHWAVGASVGALWLFIAKVLKISSVAALFSMAMAPVLVWLIVDEPALIGMQLIITGVLFWRHRSNISNLLAGKETRIGGGTTDKADHSPAANETNEPGN